MADERARDIVDQLKPRDTCGGTLTERIGRRAWERPRVSVSPRIYRLYRVPDPWDPQAPSSDEAVGLGPVALRLGEQKRQPAPHLQPKAPEKKQKGLAERAQQQKREQGPPSKKPQATPASVSTSPKVGGDGDVEGNTRLAEIAAERRHQAELARPRTKHTVTEESTHATSGGPGLRAPLPVRPDLDIAEPVDDGNVPPQAGTVRSQAGRFRMKPAQAGSAPTERSVERAGTPVPVDREQAPVPERVAPPSPGGGGLDDLFGSAMRQGRLSLAQRSDEQDEGEGEGEAESED